MKQFLLTILLSYLSFLVSAQTLSTQDSLNKYVVTYNQTKSIIAKYELISKRTSTIAGALRKSAINNLDSAKKVNQSVASFPDAKTKMQLLQTASNIYNNSNQMFLKSDSLMNLADIYQDSAYTIKNKCDSLIIEIEKLSNKLISKNEIKDANSKKDNSKNSTKQEISSRPNLTVQKTKIKYTIQLGAGDNLNNRYKGIENFNIFIGTDGIKRYTVGVFDSREDALKTRNLLIEKGYKTCFIRSLDLNSLKLIK